MKKILIAEDEGHIARLVIFKLEREGYEVTWAQDGGELLSKLENMIPDLVILDVMMPVLNGFEVLKKIRGDDRYKSLPVIMLTSKSQDKDITEGFNLGVNDYIIKPFRPSELIARVKNAIK
jgi:DNA-binding response OmpR family regulator